MKKIAVVLFNLGGPDSLKAIDPFLFNLFNDPAIISLPNPWRWLLAKFISKRRAPIAAEIYRHLGGKSPLLEMTQAQAQALELQLSNEFEVKCFIAMRYWHPMSDETIKHVADFDPDEVILLPLYPQFSITSSGSSIDDWQRASAQSGLNIATKVICCYPTDSNWIKAVAGLTRKTLETAHSDSHASLRLLFSAHGLPQKVIDKGDPYQFQVEQTCQAVVDELSKNQQVKPLDWAVCYQSKVGRLKWLTPSLDQELQRAALDQVAVCIVPIAFVSEHSETLVELDIEYRQMAEKLQIRGYSRVPTVGISEVFITGLAQLVRHSSDCENKTSSGGVDKTCPCNNKFSQCRRLNSGLN